jgi:peptidoglycan/LPS O-acetylase OafA/YrhL
VDAVRLEVSWETAVVACLFIVCVCIAVFCVVFYAHYLSAHFSGMVVHCAASAYLLLAFVASSATATAITSATDVYSRTG